MNNDTYIINDKIRASGLGTIQEINKYANNKELFLWGFFQNIKYFVIPIDWTFDPRISSITKVNNIINVAAITNIDITNAPITLQNHRIHIELEPNVQSELVNHWGFVVLKFIWS